MRGHEGKSGRRKASHKKSPARRSDVRIVTPKSAGVSTANDSGSNHAVLDTDLNGEITAWNTAAERLFGFTATEAVGQSIRLVVPPARQHEQDELTVRAEHGETIDRIETLCRRRDGSLVPIAMTVTALREPEGEIVGVSRMARDLSGRRRVEPGALRLAAIVESSDDAIVGKDLNGIVFSWNRGAERIFGYTAEEMIGRSIRTIIPDDRQSEEDDVIERIHRGERVHHFETLRRRKDGSVLPISLTISPIRDPDGVVVGASKIARDITERKQAEAERARLLNVAQEASRLKDEFLATLSHELRTPLNAILGYTRMLRSGLIGADKEGRALDTIERNATSLTEIIEDVLDVSRIISGKIRLNVRPVDLQTVIRESIEAVRPAADARNIRIECILDSSEAPVSGDPERLQQILWNLVSNAVKFTERGGRVQIRLEHADSHIELIVSDTGIGIVPEFLPYVFERFRQADSGVTREHGGLGLGLAITKHLVEMHGGTIDVASRGRGAGSTFRVKLPLMIVNATERDEPRTHPRAHRAGTNVAVAPLPGISVLAVDDDMDALMMVREILEAAGAEVTTADSAHQALSLVEVTAPDVLLADVGMPRMSGFQLIEEIRRSPIRRVREIPAAALTAYARSEDRAHALRSGFQLHLAKPIDPGELMAAIASLAKQRVGGGE
jgi:PAS domain S-box-containing protein